MRQFFNDWINVPVSVTKEQKARLRQAKDAWKDGQWAEAYAICDALVGEGIQKPEIVQLRLRAALKLDDFDKIAAAVTETADPASLFAAARALTKAGRLEEAAAAFGNLRSHHPEFSHQSLLPSIERLLAKLTAQGDAALRKGEIRQAAAIWQVAQRADPDNSGLSKRLRTAKRHVLTDATAYDLDEDAQRYADAWSLVIAVDPADKRAYKRLAMAAEKYENFSAAAECWKHLIAVDPSDEAAPARLARSAAKSTNPDDYFLFLHGRGLADSTNPHVRRLAQHAAVTVREHVKQKDFVAAANMLTHLRQFNIDDPRAQRWADATVRNLVQGAKRSLKEADFISTAKLCDLILALDAKHSGALAVLSRALFRMKAYDAAYEASRRLLALEPTDDKIRALNERAHRILQRQSAIA